MIHGMVLRACDSFDPVKELHGAELNIAGHYRHPGRKRQFLLGRVAARRLLVSTKIVQPDKMGWIERTESGWPRVLDVRGAPLDISLSISHSGNLIVCAACPLSFAQLGVDLEMVDKRIDAFYEDYFSQGEQDLLLEPDGTWSDARGTVLWVIKEAVLKSLKVGLRVDARTVEVKHLDGPVLVEGWHQAMVHVEGKDSPLVLWRWMEPGHKMVLALSVWRCLTTDAYGSGMKIEWKESGVL